MGRTFCLEERMYKTLNPGVIGIRPDSFDQALELANIGGFSGLEFDVVEIKQLVERDGLAAVKARFSDAGIRPAAFGLPVDWRGGRENWEAGLAALPELAAAASALGAVRTATYILSWSDTRPYDENLAFHIERFRPIAKILDDHGIILGLEFLGPKTLYAGKNHLFIHAMQPMLEMAAEIGGNVGLLLDSFHWYTSHSNVDDLLNLTPRNIAFVHVNDVPVGLAIDEQLDGTRGLPGETGVIDIAGFLGALKFIGYDGPVTPEPFKKALGDLPDDRTRARVVGASMDKIFKLAGM